MTPYQPTAADRAAMPRSYATAPRYLGYRATDAAKPYARYFRPATSPVQDHVRETLLAGMAPTECAYDVSAAAGVMRRPGYHAMETGWTRVPGGVMVSVLTDMPEVTAEMWDWWFGWHSTESARYKLWHPEAHQFATIAEDRSADRNLTHRQRYVGNVSYVDEYVGGVLQRLAIRFVDPTQLGFEEPGHGTTLICARVGLSQYPLVTGWLLHQVRPTEGGAEMRSRFFINEPEMLDLRAQGAPGGLGASLLGSRFIQRIGNTALPHVLTKALGATFGPDLLYHCAAEMNHLASFLPSLYAEFREAP